MFIRTQDRNGLIDINNITFRLTEPEYGYEIICYNTACIADEGYELLGHYSTKEKALKVLDMIQNAYEEYEHEKAFKTGLRLFKTFQMPKDDEVEI